MLSYPRKIGIALLALILACAISHSNLAFGKDKEKKTKKTAADKEQTTEQTVLKVDVGAEAAKQDPSTDEAETSDEAELKHGDKEFRAELITKYIQGAMAYADYEMATGVNIYQQAAPGAQKRAVRAELKRLALRETLPHARIDVRSPAVGDVGALSEPHKILEVRKNGDVLVVRESYIPRKSPSNETHFFLLKGLPKNDYREGTIHAFTEAFVLERTQNGARAWGHDTFVAEVLDPKLLEENAEAVSNAVKELKKRYRRWK